MGTRNLTMVIHNEQTKVAQYGQWDGYPDGQGKTALSFLREANLDSFRETLKRVQWVDEEKQIEIDQFFLDIGVKDGWMNMTQSTLYKERYPMFSRDNGAKVLQMIAESGDEKIYLYDQSNFAADSLMCEWAYVIDLDKNTFEVYEGFQKEPLTENDRFYSMPLPEDSGAYHQVKIIKSYSLDDLPTIEQFLKDLEPVEETE
jgi:hypothetical protein